MPTACLSQALGTRASTTVERLARPGRSNSCAVCLLLLSICVNLPHLRIQKTSSFITVFKIGDKLEPLTSGKLFELDLEVHHILLAGAVSGSTGIEAEAARLIKIPLGFLAV